MSRFQNLIDQLIDLTVELNHEFKAAGLDRNVPDLWEQAGRATDEVCLLETALVDAGLTEGARTEEEAMGPVDCEGTGHDVQEPAQDNDALQGLVEEADHLPRTGGG